MKRWAVLIAAVALAGCVAPAARRPTLPASASKGAPVAEPTAAPRTLAALIADAPELSRFRALAAAGGLTTMTAGRGSVTILAPTDAAFARLAPGTVEALLLPGNRPSLLHLLRFWVVPGTIATSQPTGPARLPTADGEPVLAQPSPGGFIVVDAAGRRGVASVQPATDGALVLLDGVVAPRSIEPGVGGQQTLSGVATPPLRSP